MNSLSVFLFSDTKNICTLTVQNNDMFVGTKIMSCLILNIYLSFCFADPGPPVHSFIFWMYLNNGDKMKLGPFKELVAQGRPRPHGSSDPPPILMVTGHWTWTMVAETESGHGKNTEFMGCSEEIEGKKLSIGNHHSAWRHGSVFLLRSLHEKTAWGRGGLEAALSHYYAA